LDEKKYGRLDDLDESASRLDGDGGLKTQQGDESLSPGMIRMNKMLGWKKPGFGDQRSEIGSQGSEVGSPMTED